jgi:hypothetical protein
MQRATQPYFSKYPELITALNRSGLGNHLGLIQMFARLGELRGEHPFVDGRVAAPAGTEVGRRSDAELAATLYGAKEAAK